MAVRAAAGAALAGTLAAAFLVTVAGPAHAAPETRFQMPFPCGQEWTGTTRAGHSPSPRAVDWNRPYDDGDPVVASAPGTVTVADADGGSGYGKWVRVTHGGEATVYAHLKSVAVRVGQTVDQGALLGAVGASGKASGPHLHFEERNSSGVMAPWFDGVAFAFGSTPASRNCVDVPMAGNFVSDAVAEVAVFRRGEPATFRIRRPARRPKVIAFGAATDQPVPGDWDGDGRLNPGVRTPATRTFQLRTPAGVPTVVFGAAADLPVAGDWDGDGRWEIGVRSAARAVFRLRSADGAVTGVGLGDVDDLPVTGDWNGDGRTDLGVFDVATATFTLRVADEEGLVWTAGVQFGKPGDLPVTGDWDGNGRTDLGTWDPATAEFSQRRAPAVTAGARSVRSVTFGRAR